MKNVKLIFKSLLSNGACVEGSRHRPWYFAVIMFFFSMILAVVPVFTMTITKKGSDVVESNSYGMDVFAYRFGEQLNQRQVDLVVEHVESSDKYVLKNCGTKTWDEGFNDASYDWNGSTYHYASHHVDNDVTKSVDFEAFYLPSLSSAQIEQFISDLENVFTTNNVTLPSLMILGEEQVAISFRNFQQNKTVSSVVGDYQSLKSGFKMSSLLVKESPDSPSADLASTWTLWKKFYDDVYNHNRKTSTLVTTGIMVGINAALTFFMGLMVFVLTRGKNNPFRIYTFWESIKISFWAALMPSILTCGFGFLLKNFAQVLFALLLGVRVMWLTMKTLGPNAAPAQSSSYNKQVKTVNARPVKK